MQTLEQWAARVGVKVQTHKSGCKFIVRNNHQDIGNIYFLRDYSVSSISSDVYWLVKKSFETMHKEFKAEEFAEERQRGEYLDF